MFKITRRQFLATGAIAATPLVLPRFAQAGAATTGDRLVVIFQRGGADGLNILVPHGDPAYYTARPGLAIPAPDSGAAGAAVDLDGFFGIHPAMGALTGLYETGQLAFVHATGLTDDSHSHFDAQQFMEAGIPGDKAVADGWIGRHLLNHDTGNSSPFRGVAIGHLIPFSMRGGDDTVAISDFDSFELTSYAPYDAALQSMYLGSNALAEHGQLAFAAMEELASTNPGEIEPEPNANYPQSSLGNALLSTAQLIKSGIGTEIVCIDSGGWDTHEGEAAAMNGLLGDLAQSLDAFSIDIGDQVENTLVVVMTEFGRRVQENGSSGTDHGYGSLIMLLGGGIQGGRVFADWPGLSPENLHGPGDLAITTDYRTVLAEIIDQRLGNTNLSSVFPGFVPTPYIGCCY